MSGFRLVPFLFDAALISTVYSGLRRASGVQYDTAKIENETVRKVVDGYFSIGDWIMDTSIDQMKKHPEYFSISKKK